MPGSHLKFLKYVTNGPKPLNTAQKAILLRTVGVQAGICKTFVVAAASFCRFWASIYCMS